MPTSSTQQIPPSTQKHGSGDYIKSFSVAPRINGEEANGGSSTVFPILKPKKSGESTPYHLKNYTGQPKRYLAVVEAVSSSLMKLAFGANFTPKVRVVTNRVKKAQVISRSLPDFRSVGCLEPSELHSIRNTQQRGLAKILLTPFCFQEPDLHTGNWGMSNQRIVTIDHDRKYASFSQEVVGENSNISAETTHRLLKPFPNSIYSVNDTFSVISPEDLQDMVFFKDIKPYNHPFRKRKINFIDELTKELSTNPEFIQWKFFYLTKYLLLLTPERVQTIIESHSLDSDLCNNNKFHSAIMAHREKIKEALFHLPKYQAFLEHFSPELHNELISEIEACNAELHDKEGKVKTHKQKFEISIAALSDDFKALREEVFRAQAEDTPEKAAQRAITLEIARIKREKSAVDTTVKAIEIETKRYENLNNLIKHLWKTNYRDRQPPLELFHTFFEDYHVERCDYNDFYKKNPKQNFLAFVMSISKESKNDYQPELLRRYENHTNEINQCLEKLRVSYDKQLTTQQIKEIGLLFSNSMEIPAVVTEWTERTTKAEQTLNLPQSGNHAALFRQAHPKSPPLAATQAVTYTQ